jgi:hypothetical protein
MLTSIIRALHLGQAGRANAAGGMELDIEREAREAGLLGPDAVIGQSRAFRDARKRSVPSPAAMVVSEVAGDGFGSFRRAPSARLPVSKMSTKMAKMSGFKSAHLRAGCSS